MSKMTKMYVFKQMRKTIKVARIHYKMEILCMKTKLQSIYSIRNTRVLYPIRIWIFVEIFNKN